MKPAAFEYVRPVSLREATDVLAHYGEDAKILAGGQTLVPMLNFRLAAPAVIIDINDIPGLAGVQLTSDGLRLGALVRWHQIESDRSIAQNYPLLAESVKHIAHYQIRNRGTWAGSCAHADPAAEFPAIALVYGAELVLHSSRGQRLVAAEQFFVGPLTTVLLPDEILVEIRFPPSSPTTRWAFEEFALRRGDFALAGVAVLLSRGMARDPIRLAAFGVGGKATRLAEAEAIIAAKGLSHHTLAEAGAAAAGEVDAQSDIHASADYRRALIEVLLERAVARAAGLEERYD